MSLSFDVLRQANLERQVEFKNAQGERAGCENWSLNDWMVGLVGEVGETANLLKKIHRGDFTVDYALEWKDLAGELADIAIYLDLLAARCNVDLGEAIALKFNQKSAQVDSAVRLNHDQNDWYRMNRDICTCNSADGGLCPFHCASLQEP